MARKEKEFHDYIIGSNLSHVSQSQYSESPATAFLNYSVDAKDAMIACLNSFKKKTGAKVYTNPALHSLQHISASLLPAIMGNFEMYQRYLFGGIFEITSYFQSFNVKSFFRKLNNEANVSIDLIMLSSYRGLKAPVGLVIADSLKSWHDPEKVNKYFSCFGGRQTFYSNDDIKKLKVLWQLRHSIVHTAGTITIPDSHKIPELKSFGGRNIVLDNNFIREVTRKLHPLVNDATKRIEANIRSELKSDVPPDVILRVNKIFQVDSKCVVWLNP